MSEFATLDVERRRAEIAGFRGNLIRRHEDELRLRINELSDEPRTRDAVHFHFLAGNPLHGDTTGAVGVPLLRAVAVTRAGAGVDGCSAASFLIRTRVNCTFEPAWWFWSPMWPFAERFAFLSWLTCCPFSRTVIF